jgi:energy-converting hydrogenase Eha subunit C
LPVLEEQKMIKKFKSLNPLEKTIAILTILLLIGIFIWILSSFKELFLLLAVLLIFPVGPIILVIFWLISNSNKRAKLAHEYEAAKDALRNNPGNVKFREGALYAGRKYYASLRDGVLSIYDEQAISNDLNAIMGSNPNNIKE